MKKQHFTTNSDYKSRQEFTIVQRAERTDMRGVKIDGWEVPFNMKNRSAVINDRGLARAIHDSSGQGGTGDVLVIPTEKKATRQRTWTVPRLPWHEEK